jgi:hypothetical protein
MDYATAAVIVLILLLLAVFVCSSSEKFTIFPRTFQNLYNDFDAYDLVTAQSDHPPYVKLYEGFDHTDIVFDADVAKSPYLRLLRPIDLKSLDIDLRGASDSLTVTLWSVYPQSATASTEATGVYSDVYREPEFAFRANSAKYEKIAEVRGGDALAANVGSVVKRVFIEIR